MIDCNMSFRRWQKLIAAKIRNAVPAAFSVWMADALVRLELVDTYLKCNVGSVEYAAGYCGAANTGRRRVSTRRSPAIKPAAAKIGCPTKQWNQRPLSGRRTPGGFTPFATERCMIGVSRRTALLPGHILAHAHTRAHANRFFDIHAVFDIQARRHAVILSGADLV